MIFLRGWANAFSRITSLEMRSSRVSRLSTRVPFLHHSTLPKHSSKNLLMIFCCRTMALDVCVHKRSQACRPLFRALVVQPLQLQER